MSSNVLMISWKLYCAWLFLLRRDQRDVVASTATSSYSSSAGTAIVDS
jgi:hypothetical protein